MESAIEPFEIRVPDEVLADLQRRLAATRFPDRIEGTGWRYGMELSTLKDWVAYWRDGFDWRAREAELNRLPHFRTTIDGQAIHFVHVRSRHEAATPLVISHGWPGSFVEFLKVIGPLTDPTSHGGRPEDAFHLVLPSLPGYGFSEPTRTPGWDVHRMAEAFARLMASLGYDRYGAQGGDWGALVTTNLGLLDADHVLGIHLNMPMALPGDTEGLSEKEKADLADMQRFEQEETGYQRIQGTKPQTLGVALNDSPAGLAAWILEKFHAWSDCDGDLETVYTKDELLTNVTIYWVTQTITSSTRLYFEVFKSGRVGFVGNKIRVPTGVARFPKEIFRFPRRWVENHYEVAHWTEFEKGGHFAAMERPTDFVDDLRRFFGALRG